MEKLNEKEMELLGEVLDLCSVDPNQIFSCSSLGLSLDEIKTVLKKFEKLGLIELEIKFDEYYKKEFWTGKINEKAKKVFRKD